MIKGDLLPIEDAGVAVVTCIGSRHMVRPFTACNDIVVTVCARLAGLIMTKRLDKRLPPRAGGVAQLACIGGIRMRGCFVAGVRPGMAGYASISGLFMRKRSD
jgi:hypothetical protein